MSAETYSDLSWRLAQFRRDHPTWELKARIEAHYTDPSSPSIHTVLIAASIVSDAGRVIALCHAQGGEYEVEACEARALDRVLALAGIGVMK